MGESGGMADILRALKGERNQGGHGERGWKKWEVARSQILISIELEQDEKWSVDGSRVHSDGERKL